ncbi:putative cytochrome P450 120 [Saccoglossus kowalevskii]|uniref:Cytochrome P450 90A1-like n=1 Tax=Saccoglossus kowalevskii TaxID=10224 RepID=A0ABM0GY19_SACKO|nr:PREDICTED: cytochrome P450 90A1-like [Saccoglossus kowalevskii]
MAHLKGHIGYPIIGDKSVEFYKDPIEFVNKRVNEFDEKIFQSRVLNTPTVFIASAEGVRQLLYEKSHNFEMGYRAFMYNLYGDNLLFSGHDEAHRIRSVLHHLFSGESVQQWDSLLEKLMNRNFDRLDSGCALPMYKVFKRFCTELSISIFLDVDIESSLELVQETTDLATTHWHGIISVPFSLKVPYWSSGFKKAIEAKNSLFEIICKRLVQTVDGDFLQQIKSAGFKDMTEAAHHVLLFISALVPKAMASLLTSFTILMAEKDYITHCEKACRDEQYLQYVLLEVQRLWPPFLGGRRLASQDCEIGGFKIPKGYAAAYITYSAQRDPKIFPDPDEFRPERWRTCNAGNENYLSCFGGGPRDCVGSSLMNRMLKTVCKYLLNHYSWLVPNGQDLTHKWLPVSRPKQQVMVVYELKSDLEQSSEFTEVDDPDIHS